MTVNRVMINQTDHQNFIVQLLVIITEVIWIIFYFGVLANIIKDGARTVENLGFGSIYLVYSKTKTPTYIHKY